MSETIELEVGDLYANLHDQFNGQLSEQYEERARQNFEEFLHNFNQQVEREVEQQQNGIELSDEEVEAIEE